MPIENWVEGGVTTTLDNLTHGDPLMITREVTLPVQFTLFGRPGTRLEDVRQILTHPHAAAQCRDWLAAKLPSSDDHREWFDRGCGRRGVRSPVPLRRRDLRPGRR